MRTRVCTSFGNYLTNRPVIILTIHFYQTKLIENRLRESDATRNKSHNNKV